MVEIIALGRAEVMAVRTNSSEDNRQRAAQETVAIARKTGTTAFFLAIPFVLDDEKLQLLFYCSCFVTGGV